METQHPGQPIELVSDTVKPGRNSHILRQAIAALFSLTFCYGFYSGVIDAAAFSGVFGTIIAFYFASD